MPSYLASSTSAIFPNGLFLNGNDMQSRDRYTAVVVEPNDHPGSAWMDARVIRTGDAVTVAAARHNNEGLEWTGLQVLTHVSNHTVATLPDTAHRRKFGLSIL